ncbi:hypothetical protein D3C85_1889250 [compost metagenome]
MQDIPQGAVLDKVADVGDTRGAAEGESDTGDGGGVPGGVRHGTGIFQRIAQRLLAQHVFAGGQEAFNHFAVQ